jgi:hypothetical protein
MPREENDDLYDEEFDFVDDDDDEEDDSADKDDDTDDDADDDADDDLRDLDDESPLSDEAPAAARAPKEAGDDEPVDEYGRPEPAANYVVHVYEYKKFKRTIDRPFTPEDAEAFATEYNRTGKSYGRFAVSGKSDAKPKKVLD